jgi:uncharacterized membrane protein SpoIIM required for sporulation
MVLEQLFKLKWIERKENSFILGFAYTLIGILSAYLILPSYLGLISIAFVSILLIPSINKLLSMEENVEIREKKFNFFHLIRDHLDIIKVYFYLFLGIFFAYFVITFIIGPFNSATHFSSQLHLSGVVGQATGTGFFQSIVLNNLRVFIAAFVLSFFYGAGSILFLTINASTWGVTFGYMISNLTSSSNTLTVVSYLLPVLPHTFTEALSYVLAAIVGGIVSKAVLREKLFSKKFMHVVTDALLFLGLGIALVIIAGAIEVFVIN